MFGEEKLYCQTEQKIDSKGRIFLPTVTKREEGEQLIIVFDKDFNVLRIYSVETINKVFDKLNDRLINAKTKEEKTKYKKEIYDFSKTILRTSKVDKQGRLQIGNEFEKNTIVKMIGAYDHLILEQKNKTCNY